MQLMVSQRFTFFSSVKAVLILIAWFSLVIYLICISGIVSEAASAPHTGGKLRIFVKAICDPPIHGRSSGSSMLDLYDVSMLQTMNSYFDNKESYYVISKKEAREVIGKWVPAAWKWKKNDFDLLSFP